MAAQPSFVVTHVIGALRDAMPEEEAAKLAPYEERASVAGSGDAAEWHRAYRCAQWAAEIVARPAHTHLAGELRKALEVVKQVEEVVGGQVSNFFEIPYGQALSPRLETEITWVYEAVHVASRVADKVGWDEVGWPALLEDLLAVPAS